MSAERWNREGTKNHVDSSKSGTNQGVCTLKKVGTKLKIDRVKPSMSIETHVKQESEIKPAF